MKMKILAILMTVLLGVPGIVSAKSGDYTMIVAPARYSVLQVMFDVIDKRSSVLVSYQNNEGDAESLLHVWNGSSWTEIGQHDLGELNFVERTPTRVVMIGNDDLLPQSIRDGLSWLPEVVVIRQLNNANLLNEFGRILSWDDNEWAWFSARYNLDLEDEAAAIRKSSWYDQSGPIFKENQPEYQPVPVVDESETLNPSSTTLPSPDAALEDEAEIIEETSEDVADESSEGADEIQEIVDTLEQNSP